jgi:PAS domain S-box-containing protein
MITMWLRSPYIDVPLLRPGTVGAYILAFVSVGIATSLAVVLDPYVEGIPFATFLPAVVVTAFISGLGAGLLAVVLSTVATDYFLLAPRLSFYIESPADISHLLQFAALLSLCVILIAKMRSTAIEREQTELALRESKDRLQLALDSARLGWWQLDPRRNVALRDARCREILDVAQDEGPFEEFLQRVHPADREAFLAARQVALDPTDPKPFSYQYRVIRRDGKVRWVETHGLAKFHGAGPSRQVVGFVGSIQDITERREHEEKEHLLMREVNHRAKNMLGVVHAIARQTAARDPADFIERFSERLQALSANQDLLIRNEWRGVEIKDLVCAQLAHFASLMGSRIVVRGPEVRLTPAAAQAVGLALHELTANAGKYGALSKDTGRLEIGWGTEGETFTMSWTERDGPPVPPSQRGFGTIVMKEMAERGVNGKVELDYAPSGVTWRLTCPAPNVLEPPERA